MHCGPHRAFARAILILLTLSPRLGAQARVEMNVVYGVYSGTALLMDVYTPRESNGVGVVAIPGSGWTAPSGPSGPLLSSWMAGDARMLTDAGYTVFALNHRATPAFRFPAPLEDVQRAVRFIRHNAARFGVDSVRLGGYGGSSGGHLVGLLATMDGIGDPDDPDPVNRRSAQIQCAVTLQAPVDLTRPGSSNGMELLALLMGGIVREGMPKSSAVYKLAWAASPIAYVSAGDAPFLLIHGDADRTVPFAQSEKMAAALEKAGVRARLIRVEGGDHGATFPGAKVVPDHKAETVKWFDECLRGDRSGA